MPLLNDKEIYNYYIGFEVKKTKKLSRAFRIPPPDFPSLFELEREVGKNIKLRKTHKNYEDHTNQNQ